MISISNNTLIPGDAKGCVWIIWGTIVIVSSLIGDSLILVGTIKYRAIKTHKLIIAVMQHLAVCDIIQTVFRVLPETITVITNRWIFGARLCQVLDVITIMTFPITMFLTCTLSTLKLTTVKYPLRTGAWSSRIAHKVCAAIWVFYMVFNVSINIIMVEDFNDSVYSYFFLEAVA